MTDFPWFTICFFALFCICLGWYMVAELARRDRYR